MISFSNEQLKFISTKYSLFIKGLVLWFVLDVFICTFHYSNFWGQDAIYLDLNHLEDGSSLFVKLISLLSLEYIKDYSYIVIVIQILLGLLILFDKVRSKALIALFYFLTLNIQTPIAYGLDGGNNLANILFLYYLIFDWENLKFMSQSFRDHSRLIAYLISILQVCLVYLVAGFSKAQGDLWLNGTALYYVMQIPQYYHPTLSELFLKNNLLIVTGNYLTIIFQLYFPLIILKQFRKIWILMGIILHISISFVLGLLQFGVLMSFVYVLFIDEDIYIFLKTNLRYLNERIKKIPRTKLLR